MIAKQKTNKQTKIQSDIDNHFRIHKSDRSDSEPTLTYYPVFPLFFSIIFSKNVLPATSS